MGVRPDLDDRTPRAALDLESFLGVLDAASYPEHGCDEELAAAERLGRLSDWLDWRIAEILAEGGVVAIAERRPGDKRHPLPRPTGAQQRLTQSARISTADGSRPHPKTR